MGKGWQQGGKKGQRFHKHRSDMVVPGVTGMLVSVDPPSTGKAIRELRLLLDPFCPKPEVPVPAPSDAKTASEAPQNSLAALLAAELDEFRKPDGAEKSKRPKRNPRQEWLGNLETNCKGYVFLNVPKEAKEATNGLDKAEAEADDECEEEQQGEEREEAAVECAPTAGGDDDSNSQEVADDTAAPAHKKLRTEESAVSTPAVPLSANGRVTTLVEAVLSNLASNPRPVTRFSYRLIPVEISCNPTRAAILEAVAALAQTIDVPPGRSAARVGITMQVKNNTTVDKEKAYLRAAIEASLPRSRFVVLSRWSSGPVSAADDGASRIEIDALLHVFVAHSTCCIGVQRHLTAAEGRRMYNLHDFGKGSLELGDISAQPGAAPAA